MEQKLGANERFDVGFCEADIIASIEEAAQGHIKWIYDCLIARMDRGASFRLGQQRRIELMKVATEIYSLYLRSTLRKSKKANFPE